MRPPLAFSTSSLNALVNSETCGAVGAPQLDSRSVWVASAQAGPLKSAKATAIPIPLPANRSDKRLQERADRRLTTSERRRKTSRYISFFLPWKPQGLPLRL